MKIRYLRLQTYVLTSRHVVPTLYFHLFTSFRVRIERVTSTSALTQHLQQQFLSRQDRGAIELETLSSQGQTGKITLRNYLFFAWLVLSQRVISGFPAWF